MQDLIKTLRVIQDRINTYSPLLTKNETLVRYALIDPLLRELDWDLSNPGEVIPEETDTPRIKTRPDYVMCNRSMIVEAKKLYFNLEKETCKLIDYIKERNVRYGVLTNGQRWKMYDIENSIKVPTMDVDIMDSDGDVLPKLMSLHKSVMLSKIPNLIPTNQEPKGWVSLPDVKYGSGMNMPTKIKWCDRNTTLASWIDVFVSVAEWLINARCIHKKNCPITSGPKNALINTTDAHQNKRKFVSPKQIQEFYIEKNMSSKYAIQNTIKLINATSLEPDDFKVYFKD